MPPSRELINLVSVMCESILLGAYAVLVGVLAYVLVKNRRTSSRMHKILFSASISMFVISVVHIGLVVQQFSANPVPLANFQAQIVLSVFQFVIGDLVLIWRVWVIWGQNYWIAAGPLVIMIIAAGLTFNLAALTETRSFFTSAPVALIVANTTICTMLIAGRIWYMHRQVVKASDGVGTVHTSRGYKGALILVIESGALYALTQLCSLILNHTDSVGLPVMLNLEIPLIGILPTLIVVLVHFNMVPGNNTTKISVPSARRWESSGATISTMNFSDTAPAKSDKMDIKTASRTTSSFDYPPQRHLEPVHGDHAV